MTFRSSVGVRQSWIQTIAGARRMIRQRKRTRVRRVSVEGRRLLESGALRSLRRITECNEPEDHELLQLLDPDSPRLIMSTEPADESAFAARLAQGMFESAGLFCRLKVQRFSTKESYAAWVAFDRKGPRPRRGTVVRELITSFDRELLEYYISHPLSTTDYPPNQYPVLSALFLGYPLREILRYYSGLRVTLDPNRTENELAQYRAFTSGWGRRLD